MCFLENFIHYQLLEDFGPDLLISTTKPRNKFNSPRSSNNGSK